MHWLRRQSERQAQEALAASLGRQLECERSLHEIDAMISGAQESERAAADPAGERQLRSGEELVAMEAYLERLAGNRAAAARLLNEQEGAVDSDRDRLLEAARERQALDRLRGKRLREHREEAARAEGEQLDELALAAHRRRGKAA